MTTSDWIALGSAAATLGGVLISLIALWKQMRKLSDQLMIQQFSYYTKRYQDIILNFPENINEKNIILSSRSDYNQIMRYMRAYFDMCYEQWFLNTHKLLDEKIWGDWKLGMGSAFSKTAFRQAWRVIKEDSNFGYGFEQFVGGFFSKFYFAYGSNLWRKQMQDRCPEHHVIGNGILKGYRWIISTRGYANIVKSTLDEVHGIVYEISESDERSLDHYEGVQSGAYRKEIMIVEVDSQSRECLVYVDPVEKEGRPKQEYIDRINKGISDSKLPSEYIDRYLRKFIPV
jgi:gamma-glutamylcyclotransferase